MEDRITKEKLEKYMSISKKALEIAKESVADGKEKEAEKIIAMASSYLSDAEHFEKNKDFVNSFAAVNYAHGWIDAGARLGIFKVKDDRLFTIE